MWPTGLYSYHSIQTSYSVHLKDMPSTEIDAEDGNDDYPSEHKNNLLRTQLLLLDFKQFKSARIIQKNFRGWSVRNYLEKQRHAAIVVQRAWRRYIARRHLILMAQEKTQVTTLIMFNTSSRKIQALFRGWWSRKHLNNMLYLKTMQLNAMEDILHCMTRRLHTMMHSDKLPGLLTFRDKITLGKVEDLLSTMTYRFYNRHVGNKTITAKTILQSQRADFARASMYTIVPYSAYNPPKAWETAAKVYERREYDVAKAFIKSQRISHEQQGKRYVRQSQIHMKHMQIMCDKQKQFCKDLIHSMNYWSICRTGKLTITENILERKDFNGFMKDLRGYLETLNYLQNCYCRPDGTTSVH